MSDLSSALAGHEIDVIVIGAGAVGAVVAAVLRDKGARVLVLDAGGPPDSADSPKVAPPDAAWRHRCEPPEARWLREIAVGGRTLVWGGWCVRACEQNVTDARLAETPWQMPLSAMDPYYARVERMLGVAGNRDGLGVVPDGVFADSVTLHPRLVGLGASLDLPIIAGRLARVTGRPWRAMDALHGVEVVPRTTALRVLVQRGQVVGVECHRGAGERVVVRAARVVLAASAVESARLLRASGYGHDGPLRIVGSLVASHLVLVPGGSADVPGLSYSAFVPRFTNVAGGAPRPYIGGFSLEVVGPSPVGVLGDNAGPMLGVSADLLADSTIFQVHALGTMLPSWERTVRFDHADRDTLGRAVPVLHLASSDNDRSIGEDMNAACLAVAGALGPNATTIPFMQPDGLVLGSESLFGRDDDREFDPEGRHRRVAGLHVADGRHAPLVGDRHPTLTMLACAARAADAVLADLAR